MRRIAGAEHKERRTKVGVVLNKDELERQQKLIRRNIRMIMAERDLKFADIARLAGVKYQAIQVRFENARKYAMDWSDWLNVPPNLVVGLGQWKLDGHELEPAPSLKEEADYNRGTGRVTRTG